MNCLPTIPIDYPDPDVIRVGDEFYMVSTTMHFMPGCEILTSKDLVNWKHAAFVYDALDSTPGQKLENGGIYGKGMWAATIRYHEGQFYVLFVANDTQKTYLYRSESIEGPWTKSVVDGFYHDASLLFDDGRVFVVYGNRHIFLTELDQELTGPLPGRIHKEIVTDTQQAILGYEGSHFYKINGRYYIFFIHSLPDVWKRVESCYVSDRVDGPYIGGDIFNDDLGYFNSGVAQGGIVDTPHGDYCAILFQDRGAAGRMPFVLPVDMGNMGDAPEGDAGDAPEGNAGDAPEIIPQVCNGDALAWNTLFGNDDFSDPISTKMCADGRTVTDSEHDCFGLKSFWQFNHEPKLDLVRSGDFRLAITTDRLTDDPVNAINALTQRLPGGKGAASVTLDASGLNVGDAMGLCALQYYYLFGGIRRTAEGFELFTCEKVCNDSGNDVVRECSHMEIDEPIVRVKLEYDFENMTDTVQIIFENASQCVPVASTVRPRCFQKDDFFTEAFCRGKGCAYSVLDKRGRGDRPFCGFL